MSIKLEVWGEYACFTRPEMKVERMSYDVITPSAARGLIESIYWHPGLRWTIDKIYVLNPINFVPFKRNEIKNKANMANALSAMNGSKKELSIIQNSTTISQRTTLALKDVHYVIEAHFELTDKATVNDNCGKFQDIITRRIEKGQCYKQPYFGLREFAAHFKNADYAKIPHDPSLDGIHDLGFMLYDLEYSNQPNKEPIPMFFRAKMTDGVIDLKNCEVVK